MVREGAQQQHTDTCLDARSQLPHCKFITFRPLVRLGSIDFDPVLPQKSDPMYPAPSFQVLPFLLHSEQNSRKKNTCEACVGYTMQLGMVSKARITSCKHSASAAFVIARSAALAASLSLASPSPATASSSLAVRSSPQLCPPSPSCPLPVGCGKFVVRDCCNGAGRSAPRSGRLPLLLLVLRAGCRCLARKASLARKMHLKQTRSPGEAH